VALIGFGTLTCSAQNKPDPGQIAKDRSDCQNRMSLHVWYHSAFQNDVELDTIWAKKRKDIVWSQNTGFWKGYDAVKGYYGVHVDPNSVKGQFQFHTVTSGVIEIAEDRQTAKDVWYTPGLMWVWERYGVDFVNGDGVWKVWHMKVYTDFATGMGSNICSGGPGGPGGPPPGGAQQGRGERFGTESSDAGQGAPPPGGKVTPTVVPKEGYHELSADLLPLLLPRPPVPYRTLSETFSYADEEQYSHLCEHLSVAAPDVEVVIATLAHDEFGAYRYGHPRLQLVVLGERKKVEQRGELPARTWRRSCMPRICRR